MNQMHEEVNVNAQLAYYERDELLESLACALFLSRPPSRVALIHKTMRKI